MVRVPRAPAVSLMGGVVVVAGLNKPENPFSPRLEFRRLATRAVVFLSFEPRLDPWQIRGRSVEARIRLSINWHPSTGRVEKVAATKIPRMSCAPKWSAARSSIHIARQTTRKVAQQFMSVAFGAAAADWARDTDNHLSAMFPAP